MGPSRPNSSSMPCHLPARFSSAPARLDRAHQRVNRVATHIWAWPRTMQVDVTTLIVNRDPRGSVARCPRTTVHRAGASTAPTEHAQADQRDQPVTDELDGRESRRTAKPPRPSARATTDTSAIRRHPRPCGGAHRGPRTARTRRASRRRGRPRGARHSLEEGDPGHGERGARDLPAPHPPQLARQGLVQLTLPGAAAARRGGGPRILPKASQALGRFTTSCACDPRAKQSRPGLLAAWGMSGSIGNSRSRETETRSCRT
jgi:hypothetical protein